jgi:hypothetical protein
MEITEHISDAVPRPTSGIPRPETFDNAAQTETRDDEWFARRRRKREALMTQLELEEEEALGRERRDTLSNAHGSLRAPTTRPEAPKFVNANSPLRIVERIPRERGSTDTDKPMKTKQVSFVDGSPSRAGPSLPTSERKEDWGDVVPDKLRDAKHESLRALKMDVVERAPHSCVAPDETLLVKKLSFTPRTVQIRQKDVDSDDEDLASSTASTSDPGQRDEEDEDDHEDEDEEGDDWDEAMFQRELALAYYEQKGVLKQLRQSVQIPPIPNHPLDPGSWEQGVRARFSRSGLCRALSSYHNRMYP